MKYENQRTTNLVFKMAGTAVFTPDWNDQFDRGSLLCPKEHSCYGMGSICMQNSQLHSGLYVPSPHCEVSQENK